MGCQPRGLCALTNLNEKNQNPKEKPSNLGTRISGCGDRNLAKLVVATGNLGYSEQRLTTAVL